MRIADLVRVGDVDVDIGAIHGVSFQCDARLCRHMESCCDFDVVIDESERARLLGLLPECARYQPLLLGADGPQNPFDDSADDGLYGVDQDEDGCVLSYRGPDGESSCALHSAALALGLDPLLHKPLACALWPLVLVEGQRIILGLDDEVFNFPCARPRARPAARLPGAFRRTLRLLFDDAWLRDLDAAARRLLP